MLDGLAFLHCLHVFLLFSSGFVSTNPETLLSQGLQVQTLKPWPLTRLSVTGNSVYGAALDGTNPARHRLEACYVFCLQTLRTLLHFEFHRLTLIQGLVTVHHDGGEVHENIFSRLALDESISLRSVKPLHRSLFLHRYPSCVAPAYTRTIVSKVKVCKQTLNPIIACLSWSVPHVLPGCLGKSVRFPPRDQPRPAP